eukprot:9447296-Karenia_brevis.AAC.1
MRNGQVYLKDYDDFLDVLRAADSGLRVINVAQFPIDSGTEPLSSFVSDAFERCKRKELVCKVESPATTRSTSPADEFDKIR